MESDPLLTPKGILSAVKIEAVDSLANVPSPAIISPSSRIRHGGRGLG